MKTILSLLALAATSTAVFASAGPGPWADGAYYPGQLDGRYSANVYNNIGDKGSEPTTLTPTSVSAMVSTTNSSSVIVDVNGILNTTNTTNITTSLSNTVTTPIGNVVSGVLGFGIRNGTPSTGTSTTDATTGVANSANTVQSIELDTSHNYFVIYVDGDCFAGQTAAGVNLDTQSVHASLWQGVGQNSYEKVTNWVVDTNGFGNQTVTLLAIPGATANGYFNADINSDQSVFTFFGAGQLTVRYTAATKTNVPTYPFKVDGIKSSFNAISGYSTSTAGQ